MSLTFWQIHLYLARILERRAAENGEAQKEPETVAVTELQTYFGNATVVDQSFVDRFCPDPT